MAAAQVERQAVCRSERDTKPEVVLIVTCRSRLFPIGAAWPDTGQLTATGVAPIPIRPQQTLQWMTPSDELAELLR